MNKVNPKKIVNVVFNVILYILIAVCVFCVAVTVFSKRDSDGAVEIFGSQIRVVTTDSMDKCELTDVSDFKIKSIPAKSMIFIETVPEDQSAANEWYSKLSVGDVLTFRYVYTTQITITHRITSITKNSNGGYTIELEGDNKSSESTQLSQVIDTSDLTSMNYVIGKVTGQSKVLGVVVSFLKNPFGIIFLIIVPCVIIIAFEVIKIVGVLNADKKKQAKEEAEKKDNELEELRRKLAELEKNSKSASEEKSDASQNSEE